MIAKVTTKMPTKTITEKTTKITDKITAKAATETAANTKTKAWDTFVSGNGRAIDVRDFIQKNYRPYDGDDSFLMPATERTLKLWNRRMP